MLVTQQWRMSLSDDHSLEVGQGNNFPEHAWYASEADRDSGRRDHGEGVQVDTPYSPLKGSRSKVSFAPSYSLYG